MNMFGICAVDSLQSMMEVLENYKLIMMDNTKKKNNQLFFKCLIKKDELREYLACINTLKGIFQE
jgi:hypothetical protein